MLQQAWTQCALTIATSNWKDEEEDLDTLAMILVQGQEVEAQW
jgi:hypothetical protein